MFKLKTAFKPCGDQPKAISSLTKGVREGKKSQVLLGVTGSGKTFTMANVIANVQRPALILAHNKTLAAQLYQEFKDFFPSNAVEYFVSYYDYYQPEAYIARTDTYIEKDLAINDQIDRMRLSATRSLLERKDVIIVSSVSCIYGLGMPEFYDKMKLVVKVGKAYRRDDVLLHLVSLQYKRGIDLARSSFRVRGDILEIMPAYEETFGFRIEFFGDECDRISRIDPLTGEVLERVDQVVIYPASHHVTPEEARAHAFIAIKEELQKQICHFEACGKLLERQRIEQRTLYDLEMIEVVGACKGIENYSRHFGKRKEGTPPPTLLNYFPKNLLLFVDESHQTLPQIRAMHNGDRARKTSLVEYGFRLPSAYDNRPLTFEEFYNKTEQVIYVSATPSSWEVDEASGEIVEQIIRPTGLLDPPVEVRKAEGQVDDVLEEIRREVEIGHRVLLTTLTKKLAEDLTKYLKEIGVKACYLHADIDTLERIGIIKQLRSGQYDVLVGINLLREGLDIPEVALVAILDGDKEGFLRSQTALIQTCGRAARNKEGRVIIYADKETEAIRLTLQETNRRRALQAAHNKREGIVPQSVQKKAQQDLMETFTGKSEEIEKEEQSHSPESKTIAENIQRYEKQMRKAAKEMRFEEATKYRDLMRYYERLSLLEDADV